MWYLGSWANRVAKVLGDLQVDMVASTVQLKLEKQDAVLVDYGAGAGRILAGLATSHKFKTVRYVAVDEPMAPEVQNLAENTGVTFECFDSRAKFFTSGITADVIMVVNTLHHIPFAEVAAQFNALLTMLRNDGFLLVHEMGYLKVPEQLNVAWKTENLVTLFDGTAFACNVRSTTSRGGVPLSNVIVRSTGVGNVYETLERNAKSVWQQMKNNVLDEIRSLYDAHDRRRQVNLHYALTTNANLDLNRPNK